MLKNNIISKRLLHTSKKHCFKTMLILYKTRMFQVRCDTLKQCVCFKAILTKPGLVLFTEN